MGQEETLYILSETSLLDSHDTATTANLMVTFKEQQRKSYRGTIFNTTLISNAVGVSCIEISLHLTFT